MEVLHVGGAKFCQLTLYEHERMNKTIPRLSRGTSLSLYATDPSKLRKKRAWGKQESLPTALSRHHRCQLSGGETVHCVIRSQRWGNGKVLCVATFSSPVKAPASGQLQQRVSCSPRVSKRRVDTCCCVPRVDTTRCGSCAGAEGFFMA